MCGRYTLRRKERLQEYLQATFQEFSETRIKPHFNIAPSQDVAAARLDARGVLTITLLRWGLIPSWATDPVVGNRND
jgi:putative SOS response-associated peptidase YedK